jgi:hypothetical protein
VSQPGSLGTAFHADRKIGTAVPRSDLERVLLGFFHGFFSLPGLWFDGHGFHKVAFMYVRSGVILTLMLT